MKRPLMTRVILIFTILVFVLILSIGNFSTGSNPTSTSAANPTNATTTRQSAGTETQTSQPETLRWLIPVETESPLLIEAAAQSIAKSWNMGRAVKIQIDVLPIYQLDAQVLNEYDLVGPADFHWATMQGDVWEPFSAEELSAISLWQVSQRTRDYYIWKDGYLGFPFGMDPEILVYRKSIFRNLRIEYPPEFYAKSYQWWRADGGLPWSIDTFSQLAEQLTMDRNGKHPGEKGFQAQDVVQYGFLPRGNGLRDQMILFGSGSLWSNGRAALPESWRAYLAWYYDALWKNQFIPNQQMEPALLSKSNPFFEGKIAMATLRLSELTGFANDTDWCIAALPSYQGVITVPIREKAFYIPTSSPNREISKSIILYLFGAGGNSLRGLFNLMPVGSVGAQGYAALLFGRISTVCRWPLAGESLQYIDSPSSMRALPNDLVAEERLLALWNEMQSDSRMDIQAALRILESDLNVIFLESLGY